MKKLQLELKTAAEKIRALRFYYGYSQTDLSVFTGYATATICRAESGSRPPSLKLFYSLSKLFNIDIEYFLDDKRHILYLEIKDK